MAKPPKCEHGGAEVVWVIVRIVGETSYLDFCCPLAAEAWLRARRKREVRGGR